jgi:uncharacterized Fe-S cluster protein YjdI
MRKTYADTEVDVSFDPEVCIHAAKCGRGLSAVFDTQRRPWIVPNAAEADEVVAQVGRCSSGALQAKRDVEPERLAPGPENLTTITAVVGAPGGSYPHRSARLRFCGSNRTVSLRIRAWNKRSRTGRRPAAPVPLLCHGSGHAAGANRDAGGLRGTIPISLSNAVRGERRAHLVARCGP